MFNKVILMGRLVADPELKTTQNGIALCRIRVAVNRPYSKDGEKKADFIGCTAWRQTAEFIGKYFTKGSAIVIEGALHNADYTDSNGVNHYAMDVQISNVEFGESKASSNTKQASDNSAAISAELGDLGDFEEILSDNGLPF